MTTTKPNTTNTPAPATTDTPKEPTAAKPQPQPASAGQRTAALQTLLDQLQKENEQLKDKAARALADYQNLERRQKENLARTTQYAKQEVFADLLQPLEHLQLAAQALHDEGLDMVVKQFWETLGAQGLQLVQPVGEKFDATTMEAIEKVGEGETVQTVVSPGFTLDGQVLRPAKVKVG